MLPSAATRGPRPVVRRRPLAALTTLALAVGGVALAGAPAQASSPPGTPGTTEASHDPQRGFPDEIRVDGAQELVATRRAHGVQIYRCESSGGAAEWTLLQPLALLNEAHEQPDIVHAQGPSWRDLRDDSEVVGAPDAQAPSPDPGSVAWLRVRAATTSGSGSGLLGDVDFVQRVDTLGGVAPAAGCEEDEAGSVVSVPYAATYLFWTLRP